MAGVGWVGDGELVMGKKWKRRRVMVVEVASNHGFNWKKVATGSDDGHTSICRWWP